jgi:hypothetical protein
MLSEGPLELSHAHETGRPPDWHAFTRRTAQNRDMDANERVPVEESLLSALGRAEGRSNALRALSTSASIATVEAAAPQLVMLTALHPLDLDAIATVLRRLDHDACCRCVVPGCLAVLHKIGAGAADYELMADLARLSFPPMLTVIRDDALRSRLDAVRAAGESIDRELVRVSFVSRLPVQPRNRWDEVEYLGEHVDSRDGVVRLLEAMADTWAHLQTHPADCPRWLNRSFRAFFEAAPSPDDWLLQPRIALDVDDLGEPIGDPPDLGVVLFDMADWYAREPCVPEDPDVWHQCALGLFHGAIVDVD